MAHIIAFGASITYGAWDREGGWVARIRKYLDSRSLAPRHQEYFLTYNLGISGDDSTGLLKRFEPEIKLRLDKDEENIIIISIGMNDSYFIFSKKQNKTTVKKFQDNLEKILGQASQYSSKITFVGLTPCDESKTNPLYWDKTKCYKNEYIEMYNTTAKEVCSKKHINFIDVLPILKNRSDLLEDGLHPNSKGHQIIYNQVKNWLDKQI